MGITLWLKGCEYNTARVIERMADIVLERGGRVKTCDDGVEIRTRGFDEKIDSVQKNIDRLELFLKDKDGKAYTDGRQETLDRISAEIKRLKNEITKLKEAENSAPCIKSRFMSRYGFCAGSLAFVLDHTYYYFEFADNPFFPDTFQKIRLDENNEYTGNHYLDHLVPDGKPKDYYAEDLWSPCADEETINAVAEDILGRLMNKPFPGRYKGDCKYINVPNSYNDGYHRERVYETDNRKRKINF